jgi:SLT domain-containing protein
MNQESGGNPRAINLWDSNAARGTPSIGLMQTIGPTFNAYAGRFRSRGIYDPFANIYAGLNYAVQRYGSLRYAMDKPGGYRDGGWLKPGQLAYNETSRPEGFLDADDSVTLKNLLKNGSGSTVKNFNLHAHVTNRAVDLVQEFRRMELMENLQ